MKYVEQPLAIEAFRIGMSWHADEWPGWLVKALVSPRPSTAALEYHETHPDKSKISGNGAVFYFRTEGNVLTQVVPGDYIVRHAQGNLSHVKASDFMEKYKAIELVGQPHA